MWILPFGNNNMRFFDAVLNSYKGLLSSGNFNTPVFPYNIVILILKQYFLTIQMKKILKRVVLIILEYNHSCFCSIKPTCKLFMKIKIGKINYLKFRNLKKYYAT